MRVRSHHLEGSPGGGPGDTRRGERREEGEVRLVVSTGRGLESGDPTSGPATPSPAPTTRRDVTHPDPRRGPDDSDLPAVFRGGGRCDMGDGEEGSRPVKEGVRRHPCTQGSFRHGRRGWGGPIFLPDWGPDPLPSPDLPSDRRARGPPANPTTRGLVPVTRETLPPRKQTFVSGEREGEGYRRGSNRN